jgi:hypothetical protein
MKLRIQRILRSFDELCPEAGRLRRRVVRRLR